LLLILLANPSAGLYAQNKYWVFFSDKDGVEFDPYTYFDASVIIKRQAKHIPLVQFSDLPLREDYVEGLFEVTGNTGVSSRWFNSVAVKADKKTLSKILELPYVIGIEEILLVSKTAEEEFDPEINYTDDQLREAQINAFGVKHFEETGIDGAGVRIAVFDGGFPGVDKSPMFQHLRESGRIIATWDFVKKNEFVYDYNSHGTSVLTCIAGVLDGKKFGLAPGAEFLLARTEVTREVFSEEENWLAAVEWADKNGADIISSSLGYTFNRYFPKNMDGKSTLVTRSANMAASKGMLVINAAGNDGDKKWEVIGAPADADSVLSIGGVSPDNGYHINFSSYGPTFDGRMKPNLVAFGKVATSNASKVKQSFGTSFATPLVSGFAACVMQIHPEWNNMEVFDELQKSGHLYPYFDYAHGFGVPQALYFTSLKPEAPPTFAIKVEDEKLRIVFYNDQTEEEPYVFTKEDSILMAETDSLLRTYEADQLLEAPPAPVEVIDVPMKAEEIVTDIQSDLDELDDYLRGYELDRDCLYFHIIRDDEQKLKRYGVVKIESEEDFTIPVDELEKGDMISVYYRGYVDRYVF